MYIPDLSTATKIINPITSSAHRHGLQSCMHAFQSAAHKVEFCFWEFLQRRLPHAACTPKSRHWYAAHIFVVIAPSIPVYSIILSSVVWFDIDTYAHLCGDIHGRVRVILILRSKLLVFSARALSLSGCGANLLWPHGNLPPMSSCFDSWHVPVVVFPFCSCVPFEKKAWFSTKSRKL